MLSLGMKQRGEVALSFFFVLYFLTFNFYLAAPRMLSVGTGGVPMVNTRHCLVYCKKREGTVLEEPGFSWVGKALTL